MLKLLENRGLSYKPKTVLKRIEKDRIIFDSGEAQYDLLYTVPPHVCPKPIVEAGLTDSSGWVPINPQTLTTRYENVYGLGDVTSVETAHGHVPFLPKAGVFALGQAEVLADNLAAKITGENRTTSWNGNGHCFLATGGEEAAFLQGSFLSNPPRLEFHTPSEKWYQDRLTFEKEILHGRF
jgi:sulfide:quinone oxidoreductase